MESVKVWQTNTDYFLEPRAAATAGATASETGDGDGGSRASLVEEGGSSGGGGGVASTVMLYVACSVFGGVLGGVMVGWWLGSRDARKWSQVYERINGTGAMAPEL